VIALPPGALIFPAFAALTQLRSVCSTRPSSFATTPTPWPPLTRFTANSLNCAVYSCLGTLNIFTLPFAYPIQTRLEDEIPGEPHAGSW
jgi:hypothetical protein